MYFARILDAPARLHPLFGAGEDFAVRAGIVPLRTKLAQSLTTQSKSLWRKLRMSLGNLEHALLIRPYQHHLFLAFQGLIKLHISCNKNR